MRLNAAAVRRVSLFSRKLRLAFVLLILFSWAMSGFGQIQQGQPASGANTTPIPGSGHDYIHLLSETVDPASGSVNLSINFGAPKGRGITLPAKYVYASSNVFSITQDATTQVIQFEMPYLLGQNDFLADGSFPVATWSESSYQAPPTVEGTGGTQITHPACNYANSFTFKDSAGVSHNLNLNVTAVAVNGPSGTQNICGQSATASGTDNQVTATFASAANTTSTVGSWPVSFQNNPPVNGSVGAFTVTDADGTTYFFNGYAASVTSEHVWEANAYKIEDRNGNVIGQTGCGTPSTAQYCDTLFRPVVLSGSGSTVTVGGVAYTLSNGTAGTASINYSVPETGGSVNSGGYTVGCPTTNWTVSASGNNSVAREQVIGLPNGTSYKLYFGDYNPNDSTLTNPYGLINEIVYPSGGWVKYTWQMSIDYAQSGSFTGQYLQGPSTGQPYPSGCLYEYSTPVVAARQVSYDGTHVAQKQTFSYTASWSQGAWTNKGTTVTTIDEVTGLSAQTIYSYVPGGINVPLEQTVARYDWGNTTTPIDIETKGWYAGLNQGQLACDFHTTKAGSAGHFYQYLYAQISDDKEYAYGQISNPAAVCTGNIPTAPTSPTPARETVTQFQSFTNALGSTFGKPSSATIYGNGTQIRQTTYGYDQTPVTSASATSHDETSFGSAAQSQRGNATTVTTGGSSTTYKYDETGQVISSTDPCGNGSCNADMAGTNHTTLYAYTDSPTNGNSAGNSNAYLTQINDPLGHTQKFTYNYPTDELASSADENSQVTTYTYSDPLYRLTQTNYPDNGQTSVCYSDSSTGGCYNGSVLCVTTTKLLNKSGTPAPEVSTTFLDGMGHSIETELTTDPSGADIVTMTYDGEGHVATKYNPYRSTTNGFTTYYYDALGRPVETVEPGGTGTLQWCYNGISSTPAVANCVAELGSVATGDWIDSTDENGNHSQRTSDSFGRLTEVMEPNGSSQSPSMETDYTYNALNDLLTVTQWGGAKGSANARSRSFAYDTLSRLTSAANPETGTISYSYDLNSNLATKTDARGITTNYFYDVLDRLVSKTYSSDSTATTPWSCYQYDSSSTPNGIGRLTAAWTQSASAGTCAAPTSGPIAKRSITAYDPMGRLLNEQQTTIASAASGKVYAPAYTYDLAGNLLTSTDGTTPNPTKTGTILTFTNTYDSAGHLTAVTSNWADATHPSPLFSLPNGPATPCANSSALPYTPFGALQNAVYGNSLTVNRGYDVRLRRTCEIDQ